MAYYNPIAHYNPTAQTKIIVDASPVGLGAILTQKQHNDTWRPMSYGSRSLTDVEQLYSQTEREALAVLWACVPYHYYIFNKSFTICTDHKPLLNLLGEKSNPPPRIKRWMLRLQSYQFHLVYIKCQWNAADCFSRNPASVTDHDHTIEHNVQYITTNVQPKSFRLGDIKKATQKDSIFKNQSSNNILEME